MLNSVGVVVIASWLAFFCLRVRRSSQLQEEIRTNHILAALCSVSASGEQYLTVCNLNRKMSLFCRLQQRLSLSLFLVTVTLSLTLPLTSATAAPVPGSVFLQRIWSLPLNSTRESIFLTALLDPTAAPPFLAPQRWIAISVCETAMEREGCENSCIRTTKTMSNEDMCLHVFRPSDSDDSSDDSTLTPATSADSACCCSASSSILTYRVMPDVLSVGTDDDYIHAEIAAHTGYLVGRSLNSSLPTRLIAQQIHAAATVNSRLIPQPEGPPYDSTMSNIPRLWQHESMIRSQIAERGIDPTLTGTLLTGHKKDVVLTPQLLRDPSRVAIFGWFYPNGTYIQPLNAKSHAKWYADYSHGIRLVAREMTIVDPNQQPRSIDYFDVLQNCDYAHLLSDEGEFFASGIYST